MTTSASATAAAVLFDRDGTLVEDVPYNGDPGLVRPVPGARDALELLRSEHVATGIVTNQSGIGRGLLTVGDVHRVHARMEQLLGPFDDFRFCPHLPDSGCVCRKPAPGMVLDACAALGVRPRACVVIGDIAADLAAATAAGALAIMVPTPVTRPDEIAAAPVLATDLHTATELAVDLLLGVRA
ncbi:D-glycero-alpha-D-manno-heptose-1,7-bisphosphate 7-phosphatase [Actinophytocola gossypii]|uniref:D,D-heptose 1,7-bisphosphate phosphatase n=1 Tax=Actinophytocola gossypii TaxID=2812003 RepID=A0ABT2J6J0_9PSEU|nr:HAD-IIIA family hydrolase [Actinophytocola gossypii]MCT2583483.1 HAD-IIIA family hydrolase [Actinophytocola gossypii]